MLLFWRAVNLQMNRTVKYQVAFSRIVGLAGKRFLFSPRTDTRYTLSFTRIHSMIEAEMCEILRISLRQRFWKGYNFVCWKVSNLTVWLWLTLDGNFKTTQQNEETTLSYSQKLNAHDSSMNSTWNTSLLCSIL